MSNLITLRQRAKEKEKTLRALLDKASAESRDLNETEGAQYNEELKALDAIDQSIKREEAMLERERRTPTVDDPNEQAAAAAGTPGRKIGFTGFGEFLQAVVKHERSRGYNADPRLQAVASGLAETAPSEGGFLVQKDFSAELIQRIYQTGQVVQRCRKIPIGTNSNGVKINAIDEDSRVDGSRWGGVLAYWINEADTFTATKPKFRQIELQLEKLIALCYTTDELLQDAAALEAVIGEAFAEEMVFKVEDAIINGTGAGQPLGVMNAGATYQVAKDSGDTGATISTKDVLNMYQHLWSPSRANSVFFYNQDMEATLTPLTLGAPSLSQVLIFNPPKNGGEATLFGRPAIAIEHCATMGTPGDIILADMSQYLVIDKGAPRQDYSIHVRFLNDEGVFRFVYRVDGQPAWKKPLTPKNGTNQLSPFVTLATRS